MPNESVRASIGSYLRNHGVHLFVYTFLLLHQEMDESAQNDALVWQLLQPTKADFTLHEDDDRWNQWIFHNKYY